MVARTLARKNLLIYNVFMMKKSLASLAIILTIPFLSSCQEKGTTEKALLTYGTYIEANISNLPTLDNDALLEKVQSDEVFLLAVNQGEYSESCLCWSTFLNVIEKYTNSFYEKVYLYNAQEQTDSMKGLGIKKLNQSTPMLYIFKGKDQIASFSYSNNKDKAIFSDITGEEMDKRVHQYIDKPRMFYVDEKYIDEQMVKRQSSVLLFMRSGCDDCKYVIPNVIIPYINHYKVINNILLFDMQTYYELQKQQDNGSKPYDNLKEKYQLTENNGNLLGYQQGVVPTIHYYEKGILKDSAVFFNDVVAKKEDGSYYISDSFYSEQRLTSLQYVNNVQNKVLKGMSLNADEVATTPSGYNYWLQEKAAVYHTPLFEAFLDYYVKAYLV